MSDIMSTSKEIETSGIDVLIVTNYSEFKKKIIDMRFLKFQ